MAQNPKLPDTPEGSRGVTITPRAVGAAVLLAILVVFIVENSARTRIRFIVPVVHAPLSLALVAGVVVGLVAGYLIGRTSTRRGGAKR